MNYSLRMYSWSLVALVLACLLLTGCQSNERIAVRNIAEIGKVLAENSEPDVASMGRVIAAEATVAADSLDVQLFGMWQERSKPSVTVEDLEADLEQALKKNMVLAKKLQEETEARIEIGGTLNTATNYLIGLIFGVGAAGGLAVRYKKQLGTVQKMASAAIKFGLEMTKANTDEDAEAVKTAAVKEQKKLGVHDKIAAELKKLKA